MLTAHATGGQYGGSYAFRLVETAQTNLPLGTVFQGQFVGSGQAKLFRLDVPASAPLRLVLNNSGAGNHTELYASQGLPPTRSSFDLRAANPASASQQLLVPLASQGTWYVLIYGDSIATPGRSRWRLRRRAWCCRRSRPITARTMRL